YKERRWKIIFFYSQFTFSSNNLTI
ncbi:hypothetical protein SNEBB_003420, partial [Seison nebaliae]